MDTPETIQVDVSHASSKRSLHEILAAAFRFPSYYGKNWDAFNDCIGDPEQSRMPKHVVILGADVLESKLPAEAKHLRECLSEARAESRGFAFTVGFDARQVF
jgi:RNAse (barnase) inhibitor barstar